jgi:hypothetical protein
MPETIRYRPWAELGAADVIFVPNWIEQPEPGGVNWTTPEAVVEGEVGVEPPPEVPVERFHSVNIRDGDDGDLELHIDSRDARAHCCLLGLGIH